MSEYRDLYDIRPATDEDVSFIMATFLNGLYYGDSWFSQIPKNIFMDSYKSIAQSLLISPKTIIQVACLKEDPNVILGYSLLSADYQAIIWVYVKAAFRKKGIARSLVPLHPTAVTHLTKLGKELLPKLPTAQFNPFWGN